MCLVECLYGCRNEWMRRSVFVKGTLNLPLLSISRESNSGLKGCVSWAKTLLSRSVSGLWQTESNVSCCLPVTPPAFLVVFSSLSLSCFEAFPPQQTQPWVRTLLIVDKKNTCRISSRTLNDLSFLRQKRREWTFLMISSLFSCQTSLLSITKPKFVHLFNSFSLDHDWFVVWFLSSKIYDHFLCLPHIQFKIVFLAPVNKSVNFLSVVRVVIVHDQSGQSCVVSKLVNRAWVLRTPSIGNVQWKKKRWQYSPLGSAIVNEHDVGKFRARFNQQADQSNNRVPRV